MPRDRAEPPRELRWFLQLRQRFECEQECLLGDILGSVPATQRLLGDQRHRAPETPHEFIEALYVPEKGRDNKLLIGYLGKVAAAHHLFVRSCTIESRASETDRYGAPAFYKAKTNFSAARAVNRRAFGSPRIK